MSLPKKNWSSLSQLKAWIETNNPKEKILYFDGAHLKTSEAVYGLGSEELYIWDKDRELIDVTLKPKEEELAEIVPSAEEEEKEPPSPKKKKRKKKKKVAKSVDKKKST